MLTHNASPSIAPKPQVASEVAATINSPTGREPGIWWLRIVPMRQAPQVDLEHSKCIWFRETGVPSFVQGNLRETKATKAQQSVDLGAFCVLLALNVQRDIRRLGQLQEQTRKSNINFCIQSSGQDIGQIFGVCLAKLVLW